MAYVFNGIEGQLGGQKGSDVLAAGAQGQEQQPGQPGAEGLQKTSGLSIGAQAEGAGGPEVKEAPAFQDASKIAEVNKGAEVGGDVFSKQKSSIADQQKALQEQANKRIAEAQSAGAGYNVQDIAKRVASGETSGIDQAKSVLGGSYTPESFSFEQQDVLGGIDAASSAAGREALLQGIAKGPYTRGQSRLDAVIFGDQLRKQAEDLKAKSADWDKFRAAQGDAVAAAQKEAQERIAGNRSALQALLGEESHKITTGISDAAKQKRLELSSRAAEGAAPAARAAANPVFEKALNDLRAVYNRGGETGLKAYNRIQELKNVGGGIDPSTFYTAGATPEVTSEMVTSPEQAERFNKIMELLGDERRIGRADLAAPTAGSFDESAYMNALLGGINAGDILSKPMSPETVLTQVEADSRRIGQLPAPDIPIGEQRKLPTTGGMTEDAKMRARVAAEALARKPVDEHIAATKKVGKEAAPYAKKALSEIKRDLKRF